MATATASASGDVHHTPPPLLTFEDILLIAKEPSRPLDESHVPTLLSLIASRLPEIRTAEDAQTLDVLPRILHLASHSSVQTFIARLLAVHWSKPLLIKLASLLRDFPSLAKVRVSEFLENIFRGMKDVDLQDLPALVYQLLLLASKGFDKKLVVRGILGFFGGSLKGSASIVRQVEGTVLMHVNFAVKQDPSLGKEVIAAVRSDLCTINHFAVAVLLSLASVSRFNESSIGALKSAVITARRDHKTARDCKWLPDCVKEECLETARCVEKAIIKAINESNFGREHVLPCIVQFGFVLLETADGENGKREEGLAGKLMSIEELGIHMLKSLFEVHDMSRNEIIEQCKFRILSLKPQQSALVIKLLGILVQSYHYLMLEYVSHLKELLEYFAFMHEKTAIALINAILPLLKFSRDLQDYIILVVRKAMFRREDSVRVAALSAIFEIISAENKLNRNGNDSLKDSSSQASSSQQADMTNGLGGGLFQELSGLLRRSLSQQARVKDIMYHGLVRLVVLDPSVAVYVLDLLWPHFLHFYIEDADFPVKIDACLKLENSKVCIAEPLDSLFSCISWILLLQPHDKSNQQSLSSLPCFGFSLSQDNEARRNASVESFSTALLKIRRTMSKCSLKSGIDQSQDSGSRSLHVERTSCHGLILAGIVEVFIHIIASELEKAAIGEMVALEKEITGLVDTYDSIEKESGVHKCTTGVRKGSSKASAQDISEAADTNSKESTRSSPVPKFPQRRKLFFSTSSIQQLLVTSFKLSSAAVTADHNVSQNNVQASLQRTSDQSSKLITFALKACLHHLKSIDSSEPSGDLLRALICGDVKQLGRSIMQLVYFLLSKLKSERGTMKTEAKAKRNAESKSEDLFLALSCLSELIRLNPSQGHLSEFLEDLTSVASPDLGTENAMDVAEDYNQDMEVDDKCVRNVLQFLEKILKPIHAALLTRSFFLEFEALSELISIIGQKLPRERRDSHGAWATSICRNNMIQNTSAARSLVSLAIHLTSAPEDLNVARNMASELLKVMGSEDKDPIEISETFPIVNHLTRTTIACFLMNIVDSALMDLDWAVSKLKAFSVFNHETSDIRIYTDGETSPGIVLEEALYSRSEALVHLLSYFAYMNLKDSQAEKLLKLTAKFYKLLARMTKLRIVPKGYKQLLPGHSFQRLAEVTCRSLTSPLYNFMALVQRNQQENTRSRGIINKIKRENRCIPDLIFQIEDYEKYLIQLSKLTKVNLLRHAKRSTARDFKILDIKKNPAQEEADGKEPSQAGSASSQDEFGMGSEGEGRQNGSEKVASPESGGDAAGDSETDKEEPEVLVPKKRAKMCKVVQDSDEEA